MGKKFFLEEVVDYTFKKYKDFRKLSIVFPNRRAGLYFQKALDLDPDNLDAKNNLKLSIINF